MLIQQQSIGVSQQIIHSMLPFRQQSMGKCHKFTADFISFTTMCMIDHFDF